MNNTIKQTLEKDLSFLHPREKAYWNDLVSSKRKMTYQLGRKTAKEAICELIQIQDSSEIAIDFGVFGFPVVKGFHNMQVSISHCDAIAIALAFPEEHPLAVDIERIDDANTDIIRRHINAREFELIDRSDLSFAASCTLCWTVKEALSKILRTGLTIEFSKLELSSIDRVTETYRSDFSHFIQYRAISMVSGNYVCSIVLPRKSDFILDSFIFAFSTITSES